MMSKPLILECDASPVGLGACLLQEEADGIRVPVHFVSRSLSSAEAHYSQVEREALSIVFAVKCLHSYLYGRKFILRTDHKPLLHIFGETANLPSIAVSRLQRWNVILSAYDFAMEHIKGTCNLAADCLSRLPLKLTDKQDAAIVNVVHANERELSELLPITAADVTTESSSDPVISQIMEFIKFG